MKLIAGVILSLSLLELFHCVPLIGSDDGGFKETNTSSSWGLHAGVDGNLGLEGGLKDGIGSIGIKKHLGVNVGGDRANSQKDTSYAINPVPAPNNAGLGLSSPHYQAPGPAYYPAPSYPNYPTPGSPSYPAAGPLYYPAPGPVYYPAPGPVYYPAPGSPYTNQAFPPQNTIQSSSQPLQQWSNPNAQ